MYRIVDWDKHFENNRTRELKSLSWVPVPNKHDGDGYTLLLEHEEGAAHYGCWCAIVQVASKCDPRGTLVRDGARPHDEHSLARMTRMPVDVMRRAIARLMFPVQWLEVVPDPVIPQALTHAPQFGAITSQEDAAESQEGAQKGREWKGREGKGKECCNEAAARPALPPSGASPDVTSPDQLVYPTFGCVKGKRKGLTTWLLAPEFVSELQQTFEGVDVAAECRAAWQWHKTNWTKRKTADGMPDFLRRWMVRAQNSGRGQAAKPGSRLPTPEDDAAWTGEG